MNEEYSLVTMTRKWLIKIFIYQQTAIDLLLKQGTVNK